MAEVVDIKPVALVSMAEVSGVLSDEVVVLLSVVAVTLFDVVASWLDIVFPLP